MRRVFIAAAIALCALALVAGPAAAQDYPPVQPPEDTGVVPGDEAPQDDDADDDADGGTAVAGVAENREALAYSGFEVTTGAVLGSLAVALGALMLVATRRRSRAHSVDHG